MNVEQRAARIADLAIYKAVRQGVTTTTEMGVWVARELKRCGLLVEDKETE